MELELVIIGNELLLGHTIDTNSSELAQHLAAVGATVRRTTVVPDRAADITSAVDAALDRAGFVITTGGLGPTADDLTKTAVADMLGLPLELDQEYLERLRQRFESMHLPMAGSNRTQAEIPSGAQVLPNDRGTAPGLWIEHERGTVVMLPGIPREARGLIRAQVVPRLRDLLARSGRPAVITSRVLRTTGITESELADRLAGVERHIAPLSLAFLPTVFGVDLRITAWNLVEDEIDVELEKAAQRITAELGDVVYGLDGADLAELILGRLRQDGMTLSVAESCTGGMLGERITAIPGSSDVFVGGVIAYSNAVKTEALGVDPGVLERSGAVSQPVVRQMAQGACRVFGSSAALAITGVAGPGGGTPEKPVGTVWLAVRLGHREVQREIRIPGGRNHVRRRAVQAALNLLRLTALAEQQT